MCCDPADIYIYYDRELAINLFDCFVIATPQHSKVVKGKNYQLKQGKNYDFKISPERPFKLLITSSVIHFHPCTSVLLPQNACPTLFRRSSSRSFCITGCVLQYKGIRKANV